MDEKFSLPIRFLTLINVICGILSVLEVEYLNIVRRTKQKTKEKFQNCFYFIDLISPFTQCSYLN